MESTSNNNGTRSPVIILEDALVPISLIMLVVSFQLIMIPVVLLIFQGLTLSESTRWLLDDRLTINLLFNFVLQLAGFVIAVLILWHRRRSFSRDQWCGMQFDVGLVMRQLSVLQFVRIVGLFVLISILVTMGVDIDNTSGNPYLTFSEATRGGFVTFFLLFIVVVIFGPLFEELVFRVLLLTELERLSVPNGLLAFLSGLVFAMAHVQTNLMLALESGSYSFMIFHFFSSMVTGVFLAHVYLRTRSLLAIWVMHALFNFLGVATLLEIDEFAVLFNVFLFFVGMYLVIRHYSLIPVVFNRGKRVFVHALRNVVDIVVLSATFLVQLVFEVLIPVGIVLLIQQSYPTDVALTIYGFVSFMLFLLLLWFISRKKRKISAFNGSTAE